LRNEAETPILRSEGDSMSDLVYVHVLMPPTEAQRARRPICLTEFR
jgi:hypothetical protein